jgi:succinoglycan biosynthesis protein ExoV
MKLFYFRGENGVTNFGDELNMYLWPRVFPDAFDEDKSVQFVGIGTLLNDRLPAAPRTVVFGAGVGYYGPPRLEDTWTIYSVRGPLSARVLGLPPAAAVTDPAALIARIEPSRGTTQARWTYAFMPHWQSQPDEWERICAIVGMGFIDPRWPPDRVLDALHRTDVLITEAMHGAIVADALRIPWVPVRTREAIKSFKWEDWCGSVSLDYRPYELPPIWPRIPDGGLLQQARRYAKMTLVARALASTARRARPLLSPAHVLRSRIGQLEDRLAQLRRTELTDEAVFTFR